MLVQSIKESSVVWAHFADVSHSSSGSFFSQNPGEELQASKEGHTSLNWSHGLSLSTTKYIYHSILSLYQFCPPMYSHLVVYETIELKRGGQKTTCYFWVMNSYKMNDTSKTFILCTLSVLRKKKILLVFSWDAQSGMAWQEALLRLIHSGYHCLPEHPSEEKVHETNWKHLSWSECGQVHQDRAPGSNLI